MNYKYACLHIVASIISFIRIKYSVVHSLASHHTQSDSLNESSLTVYYTKSYTVTLRAGKFTGLQCWVCLDVNIFQCLVGQKNRDNRKCFPLSKKNLKGKHILLLTSRKTFLRALKNSHNLPLSP